jgi:hypothetical protein
MAALARRLSSIILTATMIVGLVAPAASAASHESELLALMNAERAANGLGAVSMHSDLVDDALVWSQHLLAQGSLSHNPNLSSVTSSWDALGENVGVGTSAASLHHAFMASASHRANLLGDYDYVGIAVVEETSSKLWVTVVFMRQLGQEPEPAEEPVPYAEEQPAPGPAPSAPNAASPNAAAPATTRVAAAAPAPEPVRVIAFTRAKGQPIVD